MVARARSPSASNSMQRVKVYKLTIEGKWEDRGTGHVTVDYLERTGDLGLFVIDEEDSDTLLIHRISSEEIYRRQEDTIISWRDQEFSTELALSFQETTGCSYIWDQICAVQRNLHFNPLGSEGRPRLPMEAHELPGMSQTNDRMIQTINSELRELPSLELSTLDLILKAIMESGVSDHLRLVELILHDQDFFPKLLDLFRMCEDLVNIDDLHMIFKIVKGIIMLNSPQLFDKMLGDDFIMDIIGCLEYDPDVKEMQHHRAFLKDHVIFKEALPIKDPIVLSKIHQTYRVGYIKDVILPRMLDDGTIANLNSIIHANNAVVVSLLKDDSSFMHELFARLKASSISAQSRKDLVLFLHEFCSLSKSLQLVQQLRLFRDLVNEGIFDIITDVLQSEDKRLVLTGTDILLLFLNQDPNLLRTFIVQQEGNTLFGLLVKGMLTDFGEDMHCQFLEIIRILLDSYTLSGSQKDTIIELFYDKYMDQLVEVVVVACSPDGKPHGKGIISLTNVETQTSTTAEILSNICELLCFCVLHHPYRITCNFLPSNAIEKVLFLTRRRERYLVVAAVRFLRTLISRSEEHLFRHIIKGNLLRPVVNAFDSNGDRYNLLHSVILELFDYIRKENLKSLIVHIVETFWDQLGKFEHLGVFHSLKIKYEQLIETCETSTVSVADPRKRADDRALEKEEEDYFNEDSDEEDSASVRTPSTRSVTASDAVPNGGCPSYPSFRMRAGLVDYDDDDDDDEEYNPPPSLSKQGTSLEDTRLAGTSKLKRGPPSRVNLTDEEDLELMKRRRHARSQSTGAITIVAPCTTCKFTSPNRTSSGSGSIHKDGNNQMQAEAGSTVSRNCSKCSGSTDSRHSEDSVNSSSENAVR